MSRERQSKRACVQNKDESECNERKGREGWLEKEKSEKEKRPNDFVVSIFMRIVMCHFLFSMLWVYMLWKANRHFGSLNKSTQLS